MLWGLFRDGVSLVVSDDVSFNSSPNTEVIKLLNHAIPSSADWLIAAANSSSSSFSSGFSVVSLVELLQTKLYDYINLFEVSEIYVQIFQKKGKLFSVQYNGPQICRRYHSASNAKVNICYYRRFTGRNKFWEYSDLHLGCNTSTVAISMKKPKLNDDGTDLNIPAVLNVMSWRGLKAFDIHIETSNIVNCLWNSK